MITKTRCWLAVEQSITAESGRKSEDIHSTPSELPLPLNQYCINLPKLSTWPKTGDALVCGEEEKLPPRRQQLVTNSEFSTAHQAHNWVAAPSWHNSITALGKCAYLRCFCSHMSQSSSPPGVCDLDMNQDRLQIPDFRDCFFPQCPI